MAAGKKKGQPRGIGLNLLGTRIVAGFPEMVPGAGLEPARLAAGDFESPESTNFTTRAGIREDPNYGTVFNGFFRKLAVEIKKLRITAHRSSIPHGSRTVGLLKVPVQAKRPPNLWQSTLMIYPTIEDAIGKTPLVALQRLSAAENKARGNVILGKLEGNNPAGSVKDRPALSMIRRAEERGEIKPGDTLIEATSGNTGIALAMAAAIKGYRMILIMPEDLSIERAQTMKAFGAELILTPKSGGMEYARDLADSMAAQGKGRILDQFANPDNPRIHYETTGPEIWEQTGGKVTHFVSAMGTTGTITGVSRFLKEKNPAVRIIGAQPSEGSRIPGIRKWPEEYLPKIYDPSGVDELVYVSQSDAEETCRKLARTEGIFAGISAAGACWVAQEIAKTVQNATIVFIVCDRGDRYLSTGVFPA
jgi:S-sulfo-L-cysteine synthase (O-acetyl-L-serine-dependent)